MKMMMTKYELLIFKAYFVEIKEILKIRALRNYLIYTVTLFNTVLSNYCLYISILYSYLFIYL